MNDRVKTKYGNGTLIKQLAKTYGTSYLVELDKYHVLAWMQDGKYYTWQSNEDVKFLK